MKLSRLPAHLASPLIPLPLSGTLFSSTIFFIVTIWPGTFGKAQNVDNPQGLQQTNVESAVAEQARREAITVYLKAFVDDIEVTSRQIESPPGIRNIRPTRTLFMNGQAVKPGAVLLSAAGYAVTFTKEDSCWWFEYDSDAFSVTLKKAVGSLSIADVKAKKPLADGFELGQMLPEVSTRLLKAYTLTSFHRLSLLRATYGAGLTRRDVKDLVRTKIQNARLDFIVDNGALGGDPASGKAKTFYIKYFSDGNVNEKSFREGEHVSLP